MRIKINQEDIVKLINIAQRAVSAKSPVQILEGILFIGQNNRLKLIATDMDTTIETSMDCIIEEDGEIVINSSLFGDIVKKLPRGLVNINTKGNNVEILSGKSQFYLNGQSSDNFPLSPKVNDGGVSFNIKGDDLSKAVRQTIFATSNDVTKSHLNGIFLEKKDRNLRFVAIDGYRLAVSDVPCEEDGDMEVIVQKKALDELTKIVGGDVNIQVKKSDSHILFETEDTLIYSRLIDKKYLDYKIILEMDVKSKIIINRLDFLHAIERASLLIRDGNVNLVKLLIKDGNINISSNSEIGTSNEDIKCELEGPGLNIAFNAKYLQDGLRAIDSDEILIEGSGSLDPMKIHPKDKEDQYIYLVLPVRVGK